MALFKNKTITDLFKIEYPIIQGGMVWVSGAKLAAAVSNAGCLGLIGAGSMPPDLLKQHILKARSLTNKPFGVNIPLLYSKVEVQISIALDLGVRIFFTSAGSPKKYTKMLKEKGAIVVHVTSSPLLAKKCEMAGVDAVVAEGFEAGGHNGRDELTTMGLIPQVRDEVDIPLIAAGGIGDGRAIAAALMLGADAVQLGTRFALTVESSAHENFKQAIIEATAGDTQLSMKSHIPVRLLKNKFFQEILKAEEAGASKEKLISILGKGRAKRGMLEGDLEEGELEIGQISALLKNTPTVSKCVQELLRSFKEAVSKV